MIGVAKERTLPEYAPQTFVQWFNNRSKNLVGNPSGKVVLFADTYLNFHEPHIGIAATQLLEALNYQVIVADAGCCQRPRISHGFLKMAKAEGAKTAQKLDEYLKAGIPVVVCEPSCTSALQDDLPDLIEDHQLGQRLKEGVMMIDQFVLQAIEDGADVSKLRPMVQKVKIHGHCHQKALYGTSAMKYVLGTFEGVDVEEIPSGCCGMAGSFGYETEHYQLSEEIGSEILFPAVQNAETETSIVACGVSCRHQIHHFTGKQAQHWVELFK